MTPVDDLRTNLSPREAIAVQRRLRDLVERADRLGAVRRIAGIDVSVRDNRSRAAIVVLDPDLEILESHTAETPATFPYVPGLLAFRELPAIAKAFRMLKRPPDLVVVDGHGYAHPRRFGIACHVGVAFGIPSIGCGKSLFVGEHAPPGNARSSWTDLVHRGETIGAAVRTRDGVRPLYVSIGHRVSLETAIRWILRLAPRYRLPEPIRAADTLAGVG
ncbi:MAG TPA: deoxyribonuclease V [Planctomycetota bacterium]|nr:deoxyribonuclease V [Planctomycetota bacterium]